MPVWIKYLAIAIVLAVQFENEQACAQEIINSSSTLDELLLQQKDVPDPAAYSAQVMQRLQTPADQATYLAFTTLLRSELHRTALDGQENIKRVHWEAVSQGTIEFRKFADSLSVSNPSADARSIYAEGFSLIAGATAGEISANPFLGITAALGSTYFGNKFADEIAETSKLRLSLSQPTWSQFNDATLLRESMSLYFVCNQSDKCRTLHDNLFIDQLTDPMNLTAKERLKSDPILRTSRRMLSIESKFNKMREGVIAAKDKHASSLDNDSDDAVDDEPQLSNVERAYRADYISILDGMIPSKAEYSLGNPNEIDPPHVSAEDIEASTVIIASLFGIRGDQEAAAAVSTVGNSVANLSRALSRTDTTNLQTAAAFTNVVSAIVVTYSMMQKRGPSADEIIIGILLDLSKQIQSLSTFVETQFYSQSAVARAHNASIIANQRRILQDLEAIGGDVRQIDLRMRLAQSENAIATLDSQLRTRLALAKSCRLAMAAEEDGSQRCAKDIVTAATQPLEANVPKGPASYHIRAALERGSTDIQPFSNAYLAFLPSDDPTRVGTGQVAKEWLVYSAMLVSVMVEGGDASAETLKWRQEALRQMVGVGHEIYNALRAGQQAKIGTGIGSSYTKSAQALVNFAVSQVHVDEFGGHPFQRFDSLPVGSAAQHMEDLLSNAAKGPSRISACAYSADANFQVQRINVSGFAANPVGFSRSLKQRQIDDLWGYWSKRRVTKQDFPGPHFTDLVPASAAWAAARGLGTVELCLNRFQPTQIRFTDASFSKWNKKMNFDIAAEVDVIFRPAKELREGLGLTEQGITLRRSKIERHCLKKAYRRETSGYPNEIWFQAVFDDARKAWRGDACGAAMVSSFASDGIDVPLDSLPAIAGSPLAGNSGDEAGKAMRSAGNFESNLIDFLDRRDENARSAHVNLVLGNSAWQEAWSFYFELWGWSQVASLQLYDRKNEQVDWDDVSPSHIIKCFKTMRVDVSDTSGMSKFMNAVIGDENDSLNSSFSKYGEKVSDSRSYNLNEIDFMIDNLNMIIDAYGQQ